MKIIFLVLAAFAVIALAVFLFVVWGLWKLDDDMEGY